MITVEETVSELTPQQIESVVRVWEKNHLNKQFKMIDTSNRVYPQLVRVTKVFNDKNNGWCVSYIDSTIVCPTYFRKFSVFVSEYACQN